MENNEILDRSVGDFTMVDNEVLRTVEIGLHEKMVYILLKMHANYRTGVAFPSMKRIAELSGMSERKARSSIRRLEELQLIKRITRNNNSNLYTIFPMNQGLLTPAHSADHPAGDADPPGTQCRPPRHEVPTNDIKNNKIKDNNTVVFQRLYDLYQSKDIINHQKPTQEMKDAVRSRLKSYSPEQLEQAINNYATVLKSHDHYFSYKYGFADLMRAKDVRKFVDEADPINNFRKQSFGQPAMQTVPPQPKPVDLNSLYTAGEDY